VTRNYPEETIIYRGLLLKCNKMLIVTPENPASAEIMTPGTAQTAVPGSP